ncbi:two-component regulator propeller domain-containing protein [Rufibacter hautae]|nr:two-component regulator propeller domain-containing protein [Rufibacter hautae]
MERNLYPPYLLSLLAFLSLLGPRASGQGKLQVQVQVYDRANTPGLPTNVFQRIGVDGKGHVWAGTNGLGLVKLNPITKAADSITFIAFPTHQVRAIERDGKGDILVGSGAGGIQATGGGIRRFTQGSMTPASTWNSEAEIVSRYVNGLAEGPNGTLWAAHGQTVAGGITKEGGVGVFNGTSWRKLQGSTLPGKDVRVLSVARVGKNMWVGVDRSCQTPGACSAPVIVEFEDYSELGGTKQRVVSGGLSSLNDAGLPRVIFHDAPRNLTWVGLSSGTGVAVYDHAKGSWAVLGSEVTKLPENTAVSFGSIKADSKGNIWIGTSNGLLRFNGDGYASPRNWTLYTTEDGLPANFINGVAVDKDESVWLATSAGIAKAVLRSEMSVVNVSADLPEGRRILSPIEKAEVSLFDGTTLIDKTATGKEGEFSFSKSTDPKKAYRLEVSTGTGADKMVMSIDNVDVGKIGQIRFPQRVREQVRENEESISEFEIKPGAFTDPLSVPIKVEGYVDEANNISSLIDKDWRNLKEKGLERDQSLEGMERVLLGQYITKEYFDQSNELTGKLLSFALEFSKSLLDLASFSKKTNVELKESAEELQKKIENNEFPSFIEKEKAVKQLALYKGAIISGRIALKATIDIHKEDITNMALQKFGDSKTAKNVLNEVFSLLYQVIDNYNPLDPSDSAWNFIEAKVKDIIVYHGARQLNERYYIPQTKPYVQDIVEHAELQKESGKTFLAAAAANTQLEKTKETIGSTISRGDLLELTSNVSSTAADLGETISPLLVLASGGLLTPFASGLYATSKAMKAISILSTGAAFGTYLYRYTQVPDELKVGIDKSLERKGRGHVGKARYGSEALEKTLKQVNDSLQVLKVDLDANRSEAVAGHMEGLGRLVDQLGKDLTDARGYVYAVTPNAIKASVGFEDVYNRTLQAFGDHDMSKLLVSNHLTSYLIEPGSEEYREALSGEIDSLVLNNGLLVEALREMVEKTSSVESEAFVMVNQVLHPDSILLNSTFPLAISYKNHGGSPSEAFRVSLKPSDDLSASRTGIDVPALGPGEERTITLQVSAGDDLSINPSLIVSFEGVDAFPRTIVFQHGASIFTQQNCFTPKPSISASGSLLTSSSATENQWYLDGKIINGATNQSYTATKSGVYSVQVNGSCGLSEMSAGVTFNVTGIEEELANAIRVYPNPTTGRLRVDTEGRAELRKLTLFSLQGKVLLVLEGKGGKRIDMDVRHLGKGVLILQLQTDKGTIHRRILLN